MPNGRALLNTSIADIKRIFSVPLRVVETGSIRSYTEKSRSTLKIVQLLTPKDTLVSVEINEKHINIAKDVCKDYANITFVNEDSHKYLEGLSEMNGGPYHFHLAYLDSVNNADHIFKEFCLVVPTIWEHGLVIVDDYGRGVKCDRVIRFLNEHKHSYHIQGQQIRTVVTKSLQDKVRAL